MSESSWLWTTDGTGDGTDSGYTQANLNQIYRMMFVGTAADEGVLKNYLNALAVTNSTGRTMSVNTGGALVYGFPYYNSAAATVDLAHPVVGTTGYRIVLRASWAAQTVRVTKIESADGTAAIPAMTQVANTTWDIPLAEGTITTGDVITVTDDRVFLHPNIEIEAAMIATGTRTLWVPCIGGWNVTDNAELDRTDSEEFGELMVNGKTVECYGSFMVPSDYVSTGIVIPVLFNGGAGAVNGYASQTLQYAATGEVPQAAVTTAATTQAVTGGHITKWTSIQTAFGAIAAGDHVAITFERQGGHGSDTINADCQMMGWEIQYLGRISS
ncbi:MAG: hypothetical protein WC565_04680 [Parcubacteria group bacterium]